jgi:hypothetical protein
MASHSGEEMRLLARASILPILLFMACSFGDENPKSIPTKPKNVLQNSEKFIVYSLDPEQGEENPDGYHGWKILGSLEITDAELRRQIADTLIDGIQTSSGLFAQCFDPRHAIRVSRARSAYDFIICFHCMRAYIYEGDGEPMKRCSTNTAVEEMLNKILADAKIPLPRPANATVNRQDMNSSSADP